MLISAIPLLLGQALVSPIDRQALVTRHNVSLAQHDPSRPLQVGNGEFAFNMDVTGLQTFTPFNTLSQWGWYSSPPPQNPKEFDGQVWDTHGRPVRYPMPDPKRPGLSSWMAANPHRINLGRIGLLLKIPGKSTVQLSDLKNVRQSLDMWSGVVTSRFELGGSPVTVKTACHPDSDSVAIQITSPLVAKGQIAVFFAAPGDNPRYFSDYVGDWGNPAPLKLSKSAKPNQATIARQVDGVPFEMGVRWDGDAAVSERPQPSSDLVVDRAEYGEGSRWVDVMPKVAPAVSGKNLSLNVDDRLGVDPSPGKQKFLRVSFSADGVRQVLQARQNSELLASASVANRVVLTPASGSNALAFTCTFSKGKAPELPSAKAVFDGSRGHWPRFWKSGGAIDLSGSKDPRWKELERRIVLSQYLMAVNTAGSLPPQESGLVNNGWYGRFHMEMIWWHSAHSAIWNRWPEIQRAIGIYRPLLAGAKKLAESQGYEGARWPKCIGPDGREWPDPIHALLAWQQPHPIFFAELEYRAFPKKATLEKWREIVEETADYMASYAFFDPARKQSVLGPPIYVVSENTDPRTTQNPTFELGYWRFGLRTALEWRKRLGLPKKEKWETVLNNLAPLPQQDGLYVLHEGVKDMWTKFNFEHPALIGTFGMLPGDGVDRETMKRTFDKVMATWNFERTWGWDFPMLAMCAARLGQPDRAIDLLLHPSSGFQFDERGLATGGPFPYFPSNGGLLYAAGMLAGGWSGAPKGVQAPGFPKDGNWKVRAEGLSPVP